MHVHLQPKQAKLYDLITATGPSIPTIIGGGGAKGGGKSRGTRGIAMMLARDLGKLYPGIVITVVRRVYRDLQDNHITPIFRENPQLYPYWRAGDEEIKFGTQATIAYRYAQNEDDVKRKFLGGYESAIIIVDEAQQFTQEELQWIEAACRWTNPKGIPTNLCKLVLLFNPGDVGGPFIRRIFWLKRYEGRENPDSYAFVHIFGWDNYEWFRGQVPIEEVPFYRLPSMCDLGTEDLGHGFCCRFHLFVRETTEGRKYNAFPASIRMGYLLGNFDHFEGQYFSGVWSPACTITPGQFARIAQSWWVRWMSFDWGFAHHAACFWFIAGKVAPATLALLGIDSETALDVMILHRELVVNRTPEFELATRIVDLTPAEEIPETRRWFVGHDAFSKERNVHNTVSDLIEAVTVRARLPHMEKAVIDRVPGWRTLHDCFRRTNALRSGTPVEDIGPGPLLLISQDCPAAISAIPVLVSDPDRPEDVLKLETVEDDIADGIRYGVESWLKTKSTAPVSVRAKEVYNSTQDPTARAMKMRIFEENERLKTLPGRRFRQ